MKKLYFILGLLICVFLVSACSESKNSNRTPPGSEPEEEVTPPVVFTAIGDVPYDDQERTDLIALIADHKTQNKSEFVIHVGDIKPGSAPCDEGIYKDVSDILKQLEVPTFIVLGDNEYNDCDDPTQALNYWNQYFLHFNENWQFLHKVEYQAARSENFSWTENEVLFIGINLVGSEVHDADEWQTRSSDDANWVKQLLTQHKDDTKAAVIFAHANIVNSGPEKFATFTDTFRSAAGAYVKPILFLQGDGHFWLEDRPWGEKNILRVQVNSGPKAVQVTVDTALEDPFLFDRNFLD